MVPVGQQCDCPTGPGWPGPNETGAPMRKSAVDMAAAGMVVLMLWGCWVVYSATVAAR